MVNGNKKVTVTEISGRIGEFIFFSPQGKWPYVTSEVRWIFSSGRKRWEQVLRRGSFVCEARAEAVLYAGSEVG